MDSWFEDVCAQELQAARRLHYVCAQELHAARSLHFLWLSDQVSGRGPPHPRQLGVCSSRPSQALIGRYYCSQTPAVTENMEGTKKQEKPLQAKIQDPPSNF